jgi:hypothetical protein
LQAFRAKIDGFGMIFDGMVFLSLVKPDRTFGLFTIGDIFPIESYSDRLALGQKPDFFEKVGFLAALVLSAQLSWRLLKSSQLAISQRSR